MKNTQKYKFVIIGKYVTISVDCPTCDRQISFGVVSSEFKQFHEGLHADLAFPGLLKVNRQMLTGGSCDFCNKTKSD